ncbi:hypothetical protein ACFPK9_09360 [Rubritalea spongiae]|uniref:Flp pilus-assembly TadG-like N-terminal domain-containing protein n=1 Tax=Rubritalea spongiae TaxID=430797 RepID=A0ABW5E2V3_9BACT
MYFRRHRILRRDTGFALISSIVLLVPLCILALACVQLSVIESQQSQHSLSKSYAKTNARLALQIALTQLQLYTGKDQTTTSRADLLDSRKTPNSQTDPALIHPYYTLAYQTEKVLTPEANDSIKLRKIQKLPAYLVSGNEFHNLLDWNGTEYPENYTTALSEIPSEKSVTLKHSASSHAVKAPRISLPNNGGYAYWISDEGCKARIDSYDTERQYNSKLTHDETHHFRDYNSLRAPSQLRPIGLADFSHPERNLTLNTISLYSEEHHKLLDEHAHSYTVYSQSVLSDQQNGGLKKNLTAAINLDDVKFKDLTSHSGTESSQHSPIFLYQKSTFPAETSPVKFSHYAGVPWEVIRSYIRRPEWESNINGKCPTLSSHLGSPAHQLPYYWQSSDRNYRHQMDARLIRRQALLTRFQIGYDFSLQYQGIEKEADDTYWHAYALRQHFIPIAIFWNPYNADLKITEAIEFQLYLDRNWSSGKHNTELELTPADDREWQIFALIDDSENESPNWSYPTSGTEKFIYPFHPQGNIQSSDICRLSFHIPTSTIPAGSTAVFTAPTGNQILQYSRNTPNTLTQGYAPGNGFYSKNAKLRVKAQSENEAKPSPPTLTILRYPTAAGAEHTRLQVTNHSSFQRINWDFANILPTSGIRFIPQDQADHEPLSSGTNNGSQTPQFTAALIRKFPDITHHTGNSTAWTTPSNKLDTNLFTAPWNIFFNSNPARYGAYGAHPDAEETFTAPPQFLSGISIGASPLIHPELNSNNEAFVGHSDSFASGSNKAIQLALPRHETRTISLAHLTQLNISKWVSNYNADQSNASATDTFFPHSAIGNAFLPPNIPPANTKITLQDKHAYASSATSTHYDQSFHYNHLLWDRYFLTGARPQDHINLQQQQNFCPNKNLEAIEPLDSQHWNNPHLSATQLLLRGGFNVNSTSSEAWKCVLSATRSLQTNEGSNISENLTPFARLPYVEAKHISTPPTNLSDPTLYDGSTYRALTDGEIEALAQAIVTENKLRGPAPTLSQWINRSLNPEFHYRKRVQQLPLTSLQICYEGTLQAAINRTSINGAYNTPNFSPPSEIVADPQTPTDFQLGKLNTLTFKYHSGYGAPASLTQADVLQRIGHLLTARSDTFIIRAYGEHRSPEGEIIATAYCEAIVQRLPEYLDQTNPPETPPYKWLLSSQEPLKGHWEKNNELSLINQKFGRRYQLIHFRWLHPNEI